MARMVPSDTNTSGVRSVVRYFGSGREQLFSFREDPWERSDLAGDPAAQAQIEVFRRALQRVPGVDSLR